MSTTAAAGPSMASAGPSTRVHPDILKAQLSFRDPNTPLFVAAATAATTATGASIGAVYGMLRNDNPFRISARMGGTWLVASSTFFALREYIVTPTLIESRLTPYHDKMYTYLSAKQLGKLPAGPLNLTRGERQMRNVLDSGISGMIVGAVASWAITGARQIPRGIITGFAIASLGQGLVNSGRLVKTEVFDPLPPALPPLPNSAILERTKSSESADLQFGARNNGESRWHRFQESVVKTIKGWSPITYVGPEEQLENFDRRQEWLEARLKKIEEEELKIYERVKAAELQAGSSDFKHIV